MSFLRGRVQCLQMVLMTSLAIAAGFSLPLAKAAAATISFVQVSAANPRAAQVTASVTYQAAQSAGNLNVVAIGWGDASRAVVSVTDSRNNVYAPAVGLTVNAAGGLSQTVYYAKNIAASPAGGNTVTVTFDGAANWPDIRALEYSGADASTPVDVATTGTGNSGTSSTAAITTTNASDLLFAANVVAVTNTAAGSGFTSRIITVDGNIAEDRFVTAVGTYSATASLSSGPWVMQLVAFRAAPAAGPDTTPPTSPAALIATAAGISQISLTWAGSTDNAAVTGYSVERCQGAACANFVQVLTPVATSVIDTGLVAGTSYSYRVLAVDAAGNQSGYSNVAAATTTALDTSPPTAPSGLAAAPASANQINLSWLAATDNVAVTGYWAERCQGAGCVNFVQFSTSATTSVSDGGVVAGTSYTYRVLAVDAAGNQSAYSNVATATTMALDTSPPTVPSGLAAVAASAGQINLSWVASTDDVGVTGYRVERCLGAGCSSFAQILAPTGTSVADTGLVAGTAYSYRVRAADATGNLSAYSVVASATTTASDTVPPTAPASLTATPSSATRVNLAWTASTDDVGVTGYRVERCTGASCTTFAQVLTATATSVGNTGLTSGVTYLYRVRAVDAAGNLGAYSPIASATTLDTTRPTAPTGLSATTFSPSQVNLTWVASTDNVAVVGYRIERCQGTTCTGFAQILTPATTTAIDVGLAAGTAYRYRVRAADAAGNLSTYSNVASATTPAAPDTLPPTAPSALAAAPASTSQVNLSWSASTDNVAVTGYQVERCQGVGCSAFVQVLTPAGTSASDTGLSAATTYSYRVRAVDAAANQSAYSGVATTATPAPDTSPPTAPAGLTAASVGASQITLTWGASTDNVGVAGYRVERCQGAGCSSFAQVLTSAATSVSDTGLQAGTTYSYRVRATDAAGNLSAFSNGSSATTAQTNPVVLENQLPGSNAWQLGDLYGRPYAADIPGQIKGYASAVSVNKGDNITFYVSVNPAQSFTIDVYRIGWYQGLGGRLMQQIGPINAITQPTCPPDVSTGMIECKWAPAYTLATGTSWTSGIYLAVLKNAQGFYNYMVFTVRDDSRVGALLYQQAVTTYQAYNAYPGGTGKSLYEHNSGGANTIAGTARAVKVSFDRPYHDDGSGTLIWLSEINTIRWLEKSGYDVTYSTDVDTHRDGARLLNHRALLSLPHDEYWSRSMYDAAVAARDSGVSLAFFGANSIYWQVRFEPSSGGVANRVLVCYKDVTLDPIADPNLTTIKWRDGPVGRPEQALAGVEFTDGPNNGTASYVVINSGHWVWAGTGFVDGAVVPGIVWYEADRQVTQDPLPAAAVGTYTLLSRSPYIGSSNTSDYSNSSIYQALSGAWVFASGTMGWGWALDDFYPEGNVNTVDARIQRATANILDRFIAPR